MIRPGDTLFVARCPDDHLFFIVSLDGATIQSQLHWLSVFPNHQTYGLNKLNSHRMTVAN